MRTTKLSLYRIFRRMGIPRHEISLNTNLFSDLHFDAFDINIFLFFVETRFNIEIPTPDTMHLQTIGKTIDYLDKKSADLIS